MSRSCPTSAFAAVQAHEAIENRANEHIKASESISHTTGEDQQEQEFQHALNHPSTELKSEISNLGLKDLAPVKFYNASKCVHSRIWVSTVVNTDRMSNGHLRVILQPNDSVTVIGEYQLAVREGRVRVLGALLDCSPKIYRVFAPSTHALPVIVCLSTQSAELEIWQSDCTIRCLGDVSPLFRQLWSTNYMETCKIEHGTHSRSESFELIIPSSEESIGLLSRSFNPGPDWTNAAQRVIRVAQSRESRTIVCGPKNTGKSTFCRFVANSLWSLGQSLEKDIDLDFEISLFWLDLDPGQPEFSPPGQISLVEIRGLLLGPPFTNISNGNESTALVMKAHSIGTINPKDDPDQYLKFAIDLFAYYKFQTRTRRRPSLIVNCSGWVADSATQILAKLVANFIPTNIVAIGIEDSVDMLHSFQRFAAEFPHQILARPAIPWTASRTPVELRAMQTISYFHQSESEPSKICWTADQIMRRDSLILQYGPGEKELRAIQFLGEIPSLEHLSVILEGRLVGLSIFTGSRELIQSFDAVRAGVENIPIWRDDHLEQRSGLEPQHTELLGLVLIRSVDAQTQSIQLQLPRNSDFLQKLTSARTDEKQNIFLVAGAFDTPSWAYLEQLHQSQISSSKPERAQNLSEDLSIKAMQKQALIDPMVYGNSQERIAWVQWLRPGETWGKRWRVRRDLGRSASKCKKIKIQSTNVYTGWKGYTT